MNNLPNPYSGEFCQTFKPSFVAGEVASIYINFDNPINYADFDDLVLGLTKNGVFYDNIAGATISKDIVSTGYYIYLSFTVPAFPSGVYRLVLRNSVSSAIILHSNEIELVEGADAALLTTLVKFRHSRNIFRYGYSRVTNFYNQFRLALFQKSVSMEEDITKYTEASTNRIRLERTEVNRSMKFETFKFDEEAHEAMAILLNHDDISFNGSKYVRKGGYEINPPDKSKLSNGSVEMFDESFGTTNKY